MGLRIPPCGAPFQRLKSGSGDLEIELWFFGW